MSLLLELLRRNSPAGAQPDETISLLAARAIEIPLEPGRGFRLWMERTSWDLNGFHLAAGLYRNFPANKETPEPAYCFWVIDRPGCQRELIPYRYVNQERDEVFAQPDGSGFKIFDDLQFGRLTEAAAAWQDELREIGLLQRFLAVRDPGNQGAN